MTATLVEDPDLCLWCHHRPAQILGFCNTCLAEAFKEDK